MCASIFAFFAYPFVFGINRPVVYGWRYIIKKRKRKARDGIIPCLLSVRGEGEGGYW